MGPSDRFFLTAILGGRLHPNGIPEWGPWETSRLHRWPEDHLDKTVATTMAQKVRTAEELEAAIKAPMRVAPTRIIWIHESLEDEARQKWEAGRQGMRWSVRWAPNEFTGYKGVTSSWRMPGRGVMACQRIRSPSAIA